MVTTVFQLAKDMFQKIKNEKTNSTITIYSSCFSALIITAK